MSKKREMELLLSLKADFTGVEKSIKGMENSFDRLATHAVSSMSQIVSGIDSKLTDLSNTLSMVAKQLEALQDKPGASRTAEEASGLIQNQKLKGIGNVQKEIAKRGALAGIDSRGFGWFQEAKRALEDYSALGYGISSKLKGAGRLRSDTIAAAAMRSLTVVDRAFGELFIGSDFTSMLNAAGNKAGAAQKRATESFISDLRVFQGSGQGDENMKMLVGQALLGTTEDPSKFAGNLKELGKQLYVSLKGKPMGTRDIFKDQARKIYAQFRELSGDQQAMADYAKRIGVALPSDTGDKRAMSSAIRPVASELAGKQLEQNYRAFAETTMQGFMMASKGALGKATISDIEELPTEVSGFFGKIKDRFKKHAAKANADSEASESALMRGFDAFGYRMITISYMLQKMNFALDNTINTLVSSAIGRQQNVGRIQPILQGTTTETQGELTSYRSELQQISAKTGRNFDELARSMYDAASAFPRVKDKMAVTRVTADMAAVGFSNAERSMEGLIAVSKTYNRDLETQPRVFEAAIKSLGDLSIAAANVGTLEVDELANAMQTMAPSASNLGITINELYASIAATAGVIGNTSEASAKVKQLFVSLMSPSGNMKELYKEYGVSGGREFIAKAGGLMQALEILEKRVGSSKNYKEYTGRSQAQEAAIGLLGAKGEFAESLATAQASMLELENATWKATQGVAYWSVQYNAAMQEFKTLQAEIGEKFLAYKVALMQITNATLSVFNKEFFAAFITIAQVGSKGVGALAAFAGGLALATRALSQMSTEVAKDRAIAMAIKSGKVDARDVISEVRSYGKKSVAVAGFRSEAGGIAVLGRSAGLSTGGAVAMLSKIVGWGTVIAGILSALLVIKKLSSEDRRKKISEGYDASADPLLRAWSLKAGQLIDALSKSGDRDSVREALQGLYSFQTKEVGRELARANILSAALKPLTEKAGLGTDPRVYMNLDAAVTQAKDSDQIKSIIAGMDSRVSKDAAKDYYEMIKRYSGNLEELMTRMSSAPAPKTKEDYADEEKDEAKESFKNSIREIFSNIVLDFEGKISPYNYEEAFSQATRSYAEKVRQAEIDATGSTSSGTAAYKKAVEFGEEYWAVFTESPFAKDFAKAMEGQGVRKIKISAFEEAEGIVRGLSEQLSISTKNASVLSESFLATGTAAAVLAEMEGAAAKAYTSSLENDSAVFASRMKGITEKLEGARIAAFVEEINNAELNLRKQIAASSVKNGPWWQKNAGRESILSAGSGARDPLTLEKALEKIAPAIENSMLTAGSRGLLKKNAVDAGTLEMIGAALKSQSDISFVYRELAASGAYVGEGADRMSAAAYFLSKSAGITEATFRGLEEKMKAGIMTPADAQAFTELVQGFALFDNAAKEMRQSLEANKRSFGTTRSEEAFALKKEAASLRAASTPGSAEFDKGVYGSDAAQKSAAELAQRLEDQAAATMSLTWVGENMLEKLAKSGFGFRAARAITGGDAGEENMPLGNAIAASIRKGLNYIFKKDEVIIEGMEYKGDQTSLSADLGEGGLAGLKNVAAGLGSTFSAMTGPIGIIITAIVELISQFRAVEKLMGYQKIILKGITDVLGPIVDQVLQPVLGAFLIVGQLIGAVLAPLFQAMGPVLEIFVNQFIFAYNLLEPVFEVLHDSLSFIGVVIQNIANVILAAMSYISVWDTSDDYYRNFAWIDPTLAFRQDNLKKINMEQVQAAGSEVLNDGGTSGTNYSADTAKAPDQYFYFYIGADMITDVQGGKVVSVDYLFDLFMNKLSLAQSTQA